MTGSNTPVVYLNCKNVLVVIIVGIVLILFLNNKDNNENYNNNGNSNDNVNISGERTLVVYLSAQGGCCRANC